jgi:ABC-type sulfate transport system permease component
VAFNQFDLPKASALSVVLLVVVALLLVVRGVLGRATRRSR